MSTTPRATSASARPPRVPTPPDLPSGGSSGGPRARRARHSADDVLALAAEQQVNPALAKAISDHEAARKASARPQGDGLPRRPSRRMSAVAESGSSSSDRLPPVAASSPGKRSRGMFSGELEPGVRTVTLAVPSVPMWGGDDLQLPDSPNPRMGRGPITRSLSSILPSPSPAIIAQHSFSQASAESMASPFSPTKKLKAMTLRTSSLNPVMEAKPRKSGELLTTSQHRLRQAFTLYDVHTGMGGAPGAPFATILRREFPAITAAEVGEIQHAISERTKTEGLEKRMADRAWSEDEKKQLLTLFKTVDADGSGSISRFEFLEIASLASLSRKDLGLAFDHMVASDRRRSARTPGGSVELTIPQFNKLIENLDDAMLSSVRKALPHLIPEGKKGSSNMLVFDDGAQQLWRLVPGGRTLVRKPVDRTARSKLSEVASEVPV